MNGHVRHSSICTAAVATFATLLLIAYTSARTTLHEVYFLSGWLVMVVIAVLAFTWWRSAVDTARLRHRIQYHLQGGALLLVAVGVHTEFRIPNGGLETALFVLLVMLIASLVLGAVLLRSARAETGSLLSERPSGSESPVREHLRQWLFAHVSLCFALLALGAVHGMFVHGHGFLAYAVLGK